MTEKNILVFFKDENIALNFINNWINWTKYKLKEQYKVNNIKLDDIKSNDGRVIKKLLICGLEENQDNIIKVNFHLQPKFDPVLSSDSDSLSKYLESWLNIIKNVESSKILIDNFFVLFNGSNSRIDIDEIQILTVLIGHFKDKFIDSMKILICNLDNITYPENIKLELEDKNGELLNVTREMIKSNLDLKKVC